MTKQKESIGFDFSAKAQTNSHLAGGEKIPDPTTSEPELSRTSSDTRWPRNLAIKPKKSPTKSPFFAPREQKRAKTPTAGTTSSIAFPPLSQKSFGLIQELLADNPFQLIVAVIFLNRTKATIALPVFWALMDRFPTPQDLSVAKREELSGIIKHLGLQNQRAKTITSLAKIWSKDPPQKGRRYRTLHYPRHGDGKDIKPGEILKDDDERLGAWEVASPYPGCGDYAIDSWRIFCRDELRGVAQGYKGEGAGDGFEPEWQRVLPKDKELRAYLRWMWLRNGWEWDPLTGRKRKASEDLLQQAEAGNVAWEEREWKEETWDHTVENSSVKETTLEDKTSSLNHVAEETEDVQLTSKATVSQVAVIASPSKRSRGSSGNAKTVRNKKSRFKMSTTDSAM